MADMAMTWYDLYGSKCLKPYEPHKITKEMINTTILMIGKAIYSMNIVDYEIL
jgi:hypothetical protein